MTSAISGLAVDGTISISDNTVSVDTPAVKTPGEISTAAASKQPGQVQKMMVAIKKYATFAQLLRLTGAIGVVAAMSLFLLQGFEVANDLQRYLTLLAQTLILTAAGFLVSFLLKDNKGARVFFGLGLISVPVNFAVLGAMLYSMVSLDTQNVVYPALAGWYAAGFGQLGIAALAGAAVLIPVTFFGFAVMARPNAKLLGGLSLMSSFALLIPVRETAWVALIAIAVIYCALTQLKRRATDDSRLKTLEGRFAQMLIFIAPVLMVSRSLVLYSADIYAALVLAAMVYMILRLCVTRLNASSLLSKLAYFLAIPAAFVGAVLVAIIGSDSLGDNLPVLLFVAVFTGLMLELKRTADNPRTSSMLVYLSAGIILAVINSFTLLAPGSFSMTVAGLVTLAIALYSFMQQRKVLTIIASALLIPHAFTHLGEMWSMVDFGNWITLAVLGIAAIVGASLLERYGATWMASWQKRRDSRAAKHAAEKEFKLEGASSTETTAIDAAVTE